MHNLEHGAVIMYYRQSGDGALPQGLVARLTTIANESHNVILAPYTPLPDGTALALAAWNKLQTCPATISGPQTTNVARGSSRRSCAPATRPRRSSARAARRGLAEPALRLSGTSLRCRT